MKSKDLKKQMQSNDEFISRAAKECLQILDALSIIDGGFVSNRKYEVLTKICSKRSSDGKFQFYNAPSKIGEIFLQGLTLKNYNDNANQSTIQI